LRDILPRPLAGKIMRQVGDMKGKILIVDDNAAIVEMLQRKLEREEYDVLGCVESEKALSLCLKAKPDLIILDILMPGKNGWEIMEELKADPETRDIPVIISTVKNRPEDIERGKELQVTDHIAKPYVFSDLLEKIGAILGETPGL
jgi:CheY-like chemotaxis protein